jgi:hypothetical protein
MVRIVDTQECNTAKVQATLGCIKSEAALQVASSPHPAIFLPQSTCSTPNMTMLGAVCSEKYKGACCHTMLGQKEK